MKALEIGAGTGKATQSVLLKGYDVTAVEIGENMSEFLRRKFRAYGGFRVINSAFEDADLHDDTYDLLYAASAFHWVDATIGCPKAYRLLRDGGVFALMRFNWIPADDSAVVAQIRRAYETHFESHYGKESRRLSKAEYSQPVGLKKGFGLSNMGDYGFTHVDHTTYDEEITYTADEYIRLLDTMSDHRALPESHRAALYAQLRNIIAENNGHIRQGYLFQLYLGKKPKP
jgi:SAM-dependent methyltransferase